MQLPTRVFIVADTDAEARKLVQFFLESPGFAVSGFGLADRLLQVRDDLDVILIHSRELGRIPALSQATVPILYLVQGETRTLRPDRASAVLRQGASPAQIRAANHKLGIAHRVLDVLVPEPGLERPSVVARVSQAVAAAVSQHVRMDRKRHFGASPDSTE